MLENPAFVSVLVGSILSPLVFCCRHFSAADCKLISCRAAWLGVLVLDFFRSHPTQFESSLKKKQLRTDLFFVAQIAHSQAIHTMETPQFQIVKCVHPSPINPNPPPQTQPPNLSLTNPRDSSLIPASARRSPPSPSPRYRPHAESFHHEAVRRCTAWSTRWSLGDVVVASFFWREKKGRKTTWQNKGGLKKKVEWRHPFKKKGWGFKERQNLIETWLKKKRCVCCRMSSSRKYSEGHTTRKVGNRSTSLGCMNFTPIPAAICEKNGPTLSIFKSHKTKQKITSHGVSHQHPWKLTISPWRTMLGILYID